MGSTARCPSHSRSRLASKPFPPPPRPQSNIYRPGERIWPSLAGNWLGARQDCQPLHPPSLGSWQWRAFSFVSSRLSLSVALLPMPKREREGGPGRKKSVFPNNSLSHTHTHTHTLSHPTSCLLPSHSWHKPLNQIGKRHCHPPPLHTTPEPVPGSLGIHCQHPPASCQVPLPLQCSNKRLACQPKKSPWGAVAQPLLLALRRSLGTCLASPSTTSRSQAGTGLTTSQSNQFPELSYRWTATSETPLPLLSASWGPCPQHPLGAPA